MRSLTTTVAIDRLTTLVHGCRICRDDPMILPALPQRPRPVVYLSKTARVAIAGQAPGTVVNRTGIPFNDASGDRLRQWMGLSRKQFYDTSKIAIVPMGFCFPGQDSKGGDLPPRKECALKWHQQIFTSMPQLRCVIAIGSFAQRYHIQHGIKKTLTETVKNWQQIYSIKQKGGYCVLPLPHPSWRNTAWLKSNPWFTSDLLPALKSILHDL